MTLLNYVNINKNMISHSEYNKKGYYNKIYYILVNMFDHVYFYAS